MPSSPPAVGNRNAYDQAQAGEYKAYEVTNSYEYHPGVLVLPVAGAAAATVTVRVHAGYGTRTVNFDVAKTGNPPVLPAPADTTDDKLISSVVNVDMPQINGSKSAYDWHVAGSYHFITLGAPRIPGRDELPAGSRPATVMPHDGIAAVSLKGVAATDTQTATEVLATQIANTDMVTGTYLWPFTIMPAPWFNPDLLGT